MQRRRVNMPFPDPGRTVRKRVNRRQFLAHVGWGAVGTTALVVGAGWGQVAAQTASPYPGWIPPSPKPPKRGGILTRASSWDPPVLDPRLTQSIGLFQFATLTSNRPVRYAFPYEPRAPPPLPPTHNLAQSSHSMPP